MSVVCVSLSLLCLISVSFCVCLCIFLCLSLCFSLFLCFLVFSKSKRKVSTNVVSYLALLSSLLCYILSVSFCVCLCVSFCVCLCVSLCVCFLVFRPKQKDSLQCCKFFLFLLPSLCYLLSVSLSLCLSCVSLSSSISLFSGQNGRTPSNVVSYFSIVTFFVLPSLCVSLSLCLSLCLSLLCLFVSGELILRRTMRDEVCLLYIIVFIMSSSYICPS